MWSDSIFLSQCFEYGEAGIRYLNVSGFIQNGANKIKLDCYQCNIPDDKYKLILFNGYKPGGKSCEPFRVYNTQSNGIYGSEVRTESEWTSWNNWCPGDIIPIRVFDLGDLQAGIHTFKIEVPDAKFVGAQGEIPTSAYVQGEKK